MKDVMFPAAINAEMIKDFIYIGRGSTYPHVGLIDGVKFILKCRSYEEESKRVGRGAVPSDGHVHNEFVADCFLRSAGCNVPESKEYRADIGNGIETLRLAEFVNGVELMVGWNRADAAMKHKIREQVVATYPLQAFLFGTDTYQHRGLVDNTLVDDDGSIWFIDNGASFHYRARGGDRSEFWRRDPDDVARWFFELRDHKSQHDLRALLGDATDEDLRLAAAKYDFVALVKTLPNGYQRKELLECAAAFNEWSGSKM